MKKSRKPNVPAKAAQGSPQRTYQEQERDVYQDYQQRKTAVKQKLLASIPSSRAVSDKEERQIEFLDTIQEKIYRNMIAIDPTCFKELIVMGEPPLCFQCAVLALKILVARDQEGPLLWASFQQGVVGKEIEFLGMIYGFQQLTLDGVFSRSNIMRAKNELLKYILEASISQQQERPPFAQKYGVQIQNMVQLAENIIGFVEVYESVISDFATENYRPAREPVREPAPLEEMEVHMTVPVQSLQHSPKPSGKKGVKTAIERPKPTQPTKKPRKPLQTEVRKKSNDVAKPEVQIAQLKSEIEEIHALLLPQQEESRHRIISQLEVDPGRLSETEHATIRIEPEQVIEPKKQPKQYQTPQRNVKNSESDSKLSKLSPSKVSASYTEESRNDLYPNDVNYLKLQEAIKVNQANIKVFAKEQMELKWKIEKETKQMERNLEKLQEYDELLRASQWRLNSLQAKAEVERKDKEVKQTQKEYQKQNTYSRTESKQDSQSDSQDLQLNLKRFHQMLRNK